MSGFRITEVWAWVTLDDGDGDEGIPAMMVGAVWMPLVMADKERMDSMRPVAEDLALLSPHPLQLRRFTSMEVVDEIPGGKK